MRERGYGDVSVLDGKADQIPMDLLIEKVKIINPDIVVMGEQLHGYGGYGVLRHFKDAAIGIKKALPSTKIILGGLWYSAMPVPTLEEIPEVDFIVKGERRISGRCGPDDSRRGRDGQHRYDAEQDSGFL